MEKRTKTAGHSQEQCAPPCPPLPPPFLLSSGEGSLGEIQTLQECYHCIALAAFPGSFNTLQTPLLHRAPVFVSLLILVCVCVCSALTKSCPSVYLHIFVIFLVYKSIFCFIILLLLFELLEYNNNIKEAKSYQSGCMVA